MTRAIGLASVVLKITVWVIGLACLAAIALGKL